MQRAILLIMAVGLALPATARAQEINLSTGYLNVGRLANEQTHRVRVGTNANEMYFGASVEGKLTDGLGVVGKALVAPTRLHIWPCERTPCEPLDRWHSRPQGSEERTESFVWSVLNLGLTAQPLSFVDVAGGVSMTTISQCYYFTWGACPMHSPGLFGEVRVSVPLAERFGLGVEAGTAPILPRDGRFTVVDELSGVKESGEPGTADSPWVVPLWFGLSLTF